MPRERPLGRRSSDHAVSEFGDGTQPGDRARAEQERQERIRYGAELAGLSVTEFLLRSADNEARRLIQFRRAAKS